MPTWVWFVIAAMVLVAIVVLIVALAVGRRKRTERLKGRFGPEYERTVSTAGGQGAAEKELAERERRRDELSIVALKPEALQGFSDRWRGAQAAFVDDPSGALDDASRLVTEVMRERGYPVDDFDRRAEDISVDHPTVVANYRAAHDIHLSSSDGDAGTEQQREAFVHYRALFDELLVTETQPTASPDTDTTRKASA